MNEGKNVFAQIISFISKYEFNKCVERYQGNCKVQEFTCWYQYFVFKNGVVQD